MSDRILSPSIMQNIEVFQESVNLQVGDCTLPSGMSKKHDDIAVYLRVSTTDQTVESQLSALRPFLLAEGYDVNECSMYIDDGVSAKAFPNFTDRPAGAKMWEDVQNSKIKHIYGFKVNRFFRRMSNGSSWMDVMANKFPHIGVKTMDCFSSLQTSSGRLVWHTLLMVAEMENEQKSEATKAGQQRKQEQLGKSSHAIFGWFWDEDKQQMNPDWHQQAVIDHVRGASDGGKGQSYSSIARDLNGWGIPTSTGRTWSPQTVSRLINKPPKMQDQLHQFDPPKTFPVNIRRVKWAV